MNIYLVGFMGTGKTAVAKRLAERLGMNYVEMDEVIEKKEAKSINDIFREDGEQYFRQLEKNLIEELATKKNQVVSAGGGVVINPANIDKMKASGVIICLEASVDIIYERVKLDASRPLLQVEDPRGKIRELLESRKQHYDKSDYNIDTSDKNIEEVVDEIIKIAEQEIK